MVRIVRNEADLKRAATEGVDIHIVGSIIVSEPVTLQDCTLYYSDYDTVSSTGNGTISAINVRSVYLCPYQTVRNVYDTW